MDAQEKEENILKCKQKISELKVRALCAHLHLLLPINLSKVHSLILHCQLSYNVCCAAQRRCETALTLSCFLHFTQLVRKILPLRRKS